MSENAAYHHGESSLQGSKSIDICTDFVDLGEIARCDCWPGTGFRAELSSIYRQKRSFQAFNTGSTLRQLEALPGWCQQCEFLVSVRTIWNTHPRGPSAQHYCPYGQYLNSSIESLISLWTRQRCCQCSLHLHSTGEARFGSLLFVASRDWLSVLGATMCHPSIVRIPRITRLLFHPADDALLEFQAQHTAFLAFSPRFLITCCLKVLKVDG